MYFARLFTIYSLKRGCRFPEDIWVRVALFSSVLMSSYRGNYFKTCSSSSSGLVAPANVNVGKAFEIGSAIINSMVGEDPMKFTITKASLAVPIPAKEFGPKDSISKTAQIDPQLFFRRALSLVSSGNTDLFLSPYLISMVSYDLLQRPILLNC